MSSVVLCGEVSTESSGMCNLDSHCYCWRHGHGVAQRSRPPGRRDEGCHRERCFRGSEWAALLERILHDCEDMVVELPNLVCRRHLRALLRFGVHGNVVEEQVVLVSSDKTVLIEARRMVGKVVVRLYAKNVDQ